MGVGSVWERARKNCLSYKSQFQQEDVFVRAYAKLDLADVFRLLASASRAAQGQIIELRRLMTRRHWHITATLHKGGFGNAGGKDQELHFNILFPGEVFMPDANKRHFHVRCKALPNETVVVFQVSDRKSAA
jgi:hypothetical protein